MESTARPLAGRHTAPSRTRCTATMDSLVGGNAGPASRGEGDALASRRGGSTIIPSMTTGVGVSERLHARSSAVKRHQRATDQQAIVAATATSKAIPAALIRPRRTSHSHTPNDSQATAHQPTTVLPEHSGNTSPRDAATPPAAATATTISGRCGSGSRRIHERGDPTCVASQARPSSSHSQSTSRMPAIPATSADCLFLKARAGRERGNYFCFLARAAVPASASKRLNRPRGREGELLAGMVTPAGPAQCGAGPPCR
jgi:hypothetical protein